MAYTGKARIVECNRGGLTGAKSIDALAPYMMVHPSRNILLEKNGRRKRGGTAHLYGAALAGGPTILGIYRAIFASGTGYTLAATSDGYVYKDDTTTIKTGLSTTNYFSFQYASGEDKVFITDGANAVQQWNGAAATASDISEPATDWTTTPPFQLLLHGKGASQRLWGINKNAIYASKTYGAAGDLEKFVTSAEAIYILTDDGYGLVGGVEYGDRIMVFGKNKGYLIDDTDTTSSNWGYDPLQWDGGVAHWRLIIKTPNDIVLMSEDGEIYSATAVQSYGDYKRASLTRGSWMHDWIKEYVDLTKIAQFHGVYDPVIRAVIIWVVRNGQTAVDTALVFFLDRQSPEESWMVFDNVNFASGYSATCSARVLAGTGQEKIYTGDASGFLWKLHEANRNDNSQIINGQFRTINDPVESPEVRKHFNKLHVVCTPQGDYDLSVKIWVDGSYKTTKTLNMRGSGAVLGSFTLDTDVLGGDDFISVSTGLGYKGYRIQYEFYNNGLNQDFFISSYRTDWKPLGMQA